MNLRSTIIIGGFAVGLLSLVTACGTQAASGASAATSNTTNSSGSQSTGNRSGHGHGNFGQHGFGMGMANNTEAAKILGISTSTLQTDLKNNESLAQIAQSKGINESKLISELEADFKTQLDSQVKSGKMNSSQEGQMISRYDSNIKTMVERKGITQRPSHFGNYGNQTANNNTSTSTN